MWNGPAYGTKEHPAHGYCPRTENAEDHEPHFWEDTIRPGTVWWTECNGFKTTHEVIVVDVATGRQVVNQRVDMTKCDSNSELTMKYTEPYNTMSADENAAWLALSIAAPGVCPYDCDRCTSHLYDAEADAEDEEEDEELS